MEINGRKWIPWKWSAEPEKIVLIRWFFSLVNSKFKVFLKLLKLNTRLSTIEKK